MTADPNRAVFLSYASQDVAATRRICEALRAAGLEVWFDEAALRGGDAWDAKIRRQIKECAFFMPVISANTQARAEGYFRLEWKLAVDRTHLMADDQPFLVPVVIDDTPQPTARVPEKFREVQWTRLRGDESISVLSARVQALLSPVADDPGVAARLRVAVAEDHPVVLDGLAAMLEREGGFAVTGRAGTAAELRALVAADPPQVLVMDLMLGEHDGLALLKELTGFAAAMRIVVFSLHAEDVYAERCLRAGAHGYVMKTEPVATLFRAVRDVAAGGIAVSPRVAAAVLGSVNGRARQPAGGESQLSDRELQVFRLTGLALPTRAIAEKLSVSVKTIEAHRENIKNKLGLDSHAALVARAAQWLRETAAQR